MRRALFSLLGVVAALALPATALAAGGTVTGTVTPISVAQEVEVCLVESRPSNLCTAAAADGTYTLSGLPLQAVKIEFIPPHRSGYIAQYWELADTLSQATSVFLSPAVTEAHNIDASLRLGGVIEGVVTAVGGSALGGVEVCAVTAGQGTAAGCTHTDALGVYELSTLAPGSYRVGFFGRGVSSEYASQYYAGAASASTATPITVAIGEVKSGIDAELSKGAQITGTVSAAAGGAPLPLVPVCLFAPSATSAQQCVFSGPSGGYAFLGLGAGSYQVGFSLSGEEIGSEVGFGGDDGYLSQYYDGVASRGAARTLSLVGGQVQSGINASLLTPSQPPPSVAVPSVANSLTPAAPPIAEPKPPAKGCKRGYVKKKQKGKARCVKAKKKSKRHHEKAKKKKGKHKKSKHKKSGGKR